MLTRISCEQAKELVHRSCDDELSPSVCPMLDAHLSHCASCSRFATDVARLSLAFTKLHAASAVSATSRRSPVVERKRTISFRAWIPAVGGIAAGLVLLATWGTWDGGQTVGASLTDAVSRARPSEAHSKVFASVIGDGSDEREMLPIELETAQPNVRIIGLFERIQVAEVAPPQSTGEPSSRIEKLDQVAVSAVLNRALARDENIVLGTSDWTEAGW